MSQENRDPQICKLIDELRAGRLGRRDFLRQVVLAGLTSAAAYALLGQAESAAQEMTTFALGEETSAPPRHRQPPGRGTTQALGEETSPPQATTQAVGEETPPHRLCLRATTSSAVMPRAT